MNAAVNNIMSGLLRLGGKAAVAAAGAAAAKVAGVMIEELPGAVAKVTKTADGAGVELTAAAKLQQARVAAAVELAKLLLAKP